MKREESMGLIELLFIASLITIFIFQVGGLSMVHGLILLVLFSFLVGRLYKGGKVDKEIFEYGREEGKTVGTKFLVSVMLLIVSARLLVNSALDIADIFGVTATFIGSTIVAFGTSLPELSIDLRAVKNKEYALAIGDLFGSAVTNVTLGMGILSILNPGKIDLRTVAGLLPFLLTSILIVWYLFHKNEKISKRDALLLLTLYILFLLSQAGIQVFHVFEFFF